LREFLKIDEKSLNDLNKYFEWNFCHVNFFLQFSEIPATLSFTSKIKLGWVNLSEFQNLSKNSMICCPKIPPPKFHFARISTGFWWEVKWLWLPLCFISTLVPLPSHYPSNWSS
jgi:hypothetical protein